MVTVVNTVQPDPNEYVISEVPGISAPHTWPTLLTVATLVLLLVQVPPPANSVSDVQPFWQA